MITTRYTIDSLAMQGHMIVRNETCGGLCVQTDIAYAQTRRDALMIVNALNATQCARDEVQS